MEERIKKELNGKKPSKVQELLLDNCKVTSISGLTDEFTRLKTLTLINVGLNSLDGLPKLPALRTIDLSDNKLTGGLEKLAQNCPRLYHLNLCANKIEVIKALEPLKDLSELTALDLFDCGITELPMYRKNVFTLLPQIRYLDGFDMNDEMADIPLWPAFQFDGIGAEEDFDEESDSHDEEELTCLNSCKDVQLLLTEKESSDSDFELIQSNDIIKLEKNFNNIQIDEGKMKRKINTYFENEIKSKHQKLNSDVLNEELKQTFQKMFVELKNENSKQINALKEIIEKKDEKIISLENQVKQMNDSFDKRFGELTGLKQFNRTYKNVSYVQIKNKWKYIDQVGFICCNNKCINTDKPYGVCIEGNGYVNIINDEIRYINCIEKAINKTSRVYAEYLFNRPKGYYINYSLFYFEIKVKIEEENNKNKWMVIGLSYNKDTYLTRLLAKTAQIKNEKHEEFNLGKLSFNNGDIFGCGLVYPPTKINELPYIFFTQNGKQIGKALFSKENFDWFRPYVILRCCSVIETNFGNDLEKKPFIYEITKHEILKEFY